METEYWLFTLWTPKAGYINCWFRGFPSRQDLINACDKCGDKGGEYAIINVTKFTEEQFNKISKDNNEK